MSDTDLDPDAGPDTEADTRTHTGTTKAGAQRHAHGQRLPGTQVALVTGAAHGIGRAIATRLANDGWQVLCADHDEAALAETTTAIGSQAHPLVLDVADPVAIAKVLDVVEVHSKRLDALICNAGIMIRKPIAETTPEEFAHVLAVNLTSTFLLARAAETLLRAARGAIVTIASTRARMSEPDTESYAASKGGLVALTHALAISLGPDIRCNVVSPGWIDVADAPLREVDHAQHPAGRVGTPEDVASLVAWLVSPEAGFVTASEFTIDGGMTRKMIYAP